MNSGTIVQHLLQVLAVLNRLQYLGHLHLGHIWLHLDGVQQAGSHGLAAGNLDLWGIVPLSDVAGRVAACDMKPRSGKLGTREVSVR